MQKYPKRIYAQGGYWCTESWRNSLKYTELEAAKTQAQQSQILDTCFSQNVLSIGRQLILQALFISWTLHPLWLDLKCRWLLTLGRVISSCLIMRWHWIMDTYCLAWFVSIEVSPLVFAQNLVRCIGPRNLSGLLQRYPVCASIGLRITFLAIVTEHLILGPATLLSLFASKSFRYHIRTAMMN